VETELAVRIVPLPHRAGHGRGEPARTDLGCIEGREKRHGSVRVTGPRTGPHPPAGRVAVYSLGRLRTAPVGGGER
jgi:hypothetical protein